MSETGGSTHATCLFNAVVILDQSTHSPDVSGDLMLCT